MLGLNCFLYISNCLLLFGPDLNLIRKIREGSKQLYKSWGRIRTIDMATLAGLIDSTPSLVSFLSDILWRGGLGQSGR